MSVDELAHNPQQAIIAAWLACDDQEKVKALYAKALAQKNALLGDAVHLRGLIELSNICAKDCFYCGIRCSNTKVVRYDLSDEEVLEAADFAQKAGYGSLVIQSGERSAPTFTKRISRLVTEIKSISNNQLGITLSCGEHPLEVYQEWFAAGAHRYLLRIESSNPNLYASLHPSGTRHSYKSRLQALGAVKKAGFQTGTGVMIGLPGQTVFDLADDLLFFKELDVDMVGMGPYLEHVDTPFFTLKETLWPKDKRLAMSLKMIAILRLIMPDINIAATTALQALDPYGREKGVLAGANIIMPNMTMAKVRQNYRIYDLKPGLEEDAELSKSHLEENLAAMGIRIARNEWGDSLHFGKC
ncbi:MAG: [FeFe] hydrogenase H-cluster radical SAM maturase HydE [Bacteroidetes bacterium]|nr:[FeFe] hydrogenase H-cluster radical SAM maturase HydE [Bacteroidota bacterium]